MFIRLIVFSLLFCTTIARGSEKIQYDQVIVLAGDKHRLSAFSPLLEGVVAGNANVQFFGMNVNPNRGDHIKDLAQVQSLMDASFDSEKRVLVLSWSISSKLVVDLLSSHVNIDRVIMFDPMDGSPPLSRKSWRRPETTHRSLARTNLDVLILKAEFSHRSNFIFKSICDKKSEVYESFLDQYRNTNLTTHVIKGAGHLDLIYGPFGLGARIACRGGPKKKAIVLYEVKKHIDAFIKNKKVVSFKDCGIKLKHAQRFRWRSYCVDGKLRSRKFMKNTRG